MCDGLNIAKLGRALCEAFVVYAKLYLLALQSTGANPYELGLMLLKILFNTHFYYTIKYTSAFPEFH